MDALPLEMIPILSSFAPMFSARVFDHVPVLIAGAILAPGKRTVTSILRVMGLGQYLHFQTYHRVLNRDQWSGLAGAKILFRQLVSVLAPEGEVVVGLDETLERRRGERISAKGIYRDAVRSSKSFFVKSSGLRWVVMDLLVEIPWAKRVWALPFLSVPAPSTRYHEERKERHKTIVDWAGQMLLQVRRWCPDRPLIAVADSAYAVLRLLDRCRKLDLTLVTRLRLDAGLYDPAPEREPGTVGRPRRKGARQPTLEQRLNDPATEWSRVTVSDWYGEGERTVEVATNTSVWYHGGEPVVPIRWVLIRPLPKAEDGMKPFDPQALLCTDLEASPEQILGWFIRRWPMEVTFEEARAHLGVETQRQWNELAIERTTPVLLGLFSRVTLWAHPAAQEGRLPVRKEAWYNKELPTFSDALAYVRRLLWNEVSEGVQATEGFGMSGVGPHLPKLQQALLSRLTETLCYAN